jgi:hypothetical protein
VVRDTVEFRARLVVVLLLLVVTGLETPVPVGPMGKALIVPFP